MDTRRDLTRNILVTVAVLVVVLPSVWLGTSFGKLALFGVIGVAAVIVAVYVGFRHPLWYFWGLALTMSVLPFGRVPGIGLPLWYGFAFGAIVAAFVHPRFARSTHPIEFAGWVMYLTCALSLVVTFESIRDASLFVRWSLGALFLFALARLAPEHAVRFGRIFSVGMAVNGLYGMFVIAFDPGYSTLAYLRTFGYAPEALVARVAYAGENVATTIRLGGTWLEPNGFGLFTALALGITFLVWAGWKRWTLVIILSVAMVLTLSRAATFTVVAGVLIVLAFTHMRGRTRGSVLAVMAIGVVAALSAEPVRRRIFSSFGAGDAGSAARADALRVFPGQMSGYWGFGHGWGGREFYDSAYAYVLNLPSNATLMVLYRSGFIAFIAWIALTVIACVYAYRSVRSDSLPRALYGGIFIGLCVVQMQLDHPLSDTPNGALCFSMFLAFLVHADRARAAQQLLGTASTEDPDSLVVHDVPPPRQPTMSPVAGSTR